MGQVAISWLAVAAAAAATTDAAAAVAARQGFDNSFDMLTSFKSIQPILMSYRLAVLDIMLAISYVRLVICEDHDYKGKGNKETLQWSHH